MTNETAVRLLRPEDAAAFRALRLRALLEEPIPFTATYEEEVRDSVQEVAARLAAGTAGTGVLGAFRVDALVGTLGFYRHAHTKARHRVSLWAMYVAPELRRRGIGRALLDEAIAHLRTVGDVEQVELAVVPTEEPARRLYVARGFESQGVLRRAVRDGERYLDQELMVLRLLPQGIGSPTHRRSWSR
jgi:ribosomal protein S18 acetylase RimI-like enzyme